MGQAAAAVLDAEQLACGIVLIAADNVLAVGGVAAGWGMGLCVRGAALGLAFQQSAQGIEPVAAGECALCAQNFPVQVIPLEVADEFAVQVDLVDVAGAVDQGVEAAAKRCHQPTNLDNHPHYFLQSAHLPLSSTPSHSSWECAEPLGLFCICWQGFLFMRPRRIAILIDGSFFLKRLPKFCGSRTLQQH